MSQAWAPGDALYGRLELPTLVRRLATSDPLIQRLREVRMPNIPFVSYPSFAGVTRFEHSLGVAHLAWWWANRNGLDQEDAEALSLAGLYHDAATPAFSHLFEEFLSRNGFDHERALEDVLCANPSLYGGRHAQVFLGRACLLRPELAKHQASSKLLTATGIAKLSRGETSLGVAMHGEVDIDNIDNVIRAVRAMGINNGLAYSTDPYAVASALEFDGDHVALASDANRAIQAWKQLRRLLYGAIQGDSREFVTQTTIKWAIEEAYKVDRALHDPQAWTLSEPELVFQHLRAHDRSRELIDRVRSGRLPDLVASAWVPDLGPLLREGSDVKTAALLGELADALGQDMYVNFYVDKRERPVTLPRSSSLTLFDDTLGVAAGSEAPSAGPRPGVFGIVSVTKPDARSSRSLSPSILLDRIAEVLSRVLGSEPVEVARRWLGQVR